MNWARPWPWLLLTAVVAGVAIAYGLHQRELENQAFSLRLQQLREQKDYSAETVPCSVRFARGGVFRVTAYDEVLRWQGLLPELAEGDDDSEGETWAEFYTTGSEAAAGEFLTHAHADLSHRLVRQRLTYLYFLGRSDEADRLQWRELLRAQDGGWSLRVAWIETPHGLARVAPPASAYAPTLTAARLSDWRRVEAAEHPDWQWHTLDSGQHPQRDAWRDAQQALKRNWGNDPKQLAEWTGRFEREHVHFHLVEAARDLGAGQVLVLRRFGPIVGANTLARSMDEIAAMTASLKCTPR